MQHTHTPNAPKVRYYAVKAYGLPGHPFPQFFDSYLTMTQARKAAETMIRDGWRFAEIYRDAKKPAGYFGVPRDVVATVGTP